MIIISFDMEKITKDALAKIKMLFDILLDLKYFHDINFTFSIDNEVEI